MIHNDQQGFSLLETLLALSLLAMTALTAASLASQLSKQLSVINTKMLLVDTQSFLSRVYSDSELCTCQLTTLASSPVKVETSVASPPDVSLTALRSSCSSAVGTTVAQTGTKLLGPNTSLDVTNIRLTNLVPTGLPLEYTAELRITADRGDGIPVSPMRVPLRIQLSPPVATETLLPVQRCLSLAAPKLGYSTCPTGFTLIGEPNNPSSYCIDQFQRPAKDTMSAIAECRSLSYADYNTPMLCNAGQVLYACSLGAVPYSSSNELALKALPDTPSITGTNGIWEYQVDWTSCSVPFYLPRSYAERFRCCM